MKKSIYFFLFIIITGCVLNNDEVKKLGWKYGNGFHIGDVISFDEIYTLRNDTIFFNNKAKAKIVSSRRRIDGSEILIIKSLINNKKGNYYAKW